MAMSLKARVGPLDKASKNTPGSKARKGVMAAVPHVIACQKTLEGEIRQVIAKGEDENVFVCNEEGIRFGGVNKTKTGRILAEQQKEKASLDHTKRIERLMHSPPNNAGAEYSPTQPHP